MEGATSALARFAAGLKYEDLGVELVERFKTYLLDAVGCAAHGFLLPWARIVNGYLKDQGGRKEATLWFEDFRGPASGAALGVGVMIHAFDFDDYHNAKIHPGAAVIPAALAAGEAAGASGREVLTALVAGYETMIRVSLATGPNASRLKGWHLTGTTGTFGAAAAAGRILGLDEERMASALGMAGTQSAGLWAFLADGAMSKRFHPGRASQSGVMAAELASRGFRGPTKILEAADGGFCRATSEAVDLSRIEEGLGTNFLCGETKIKPYACCASSHSAVDALLGLKEEYGLVPAQVEKVVVRTARGVQLQCGFPYRGLGVVEAQMSLKYICAVVLAEGAALLEQFTEEKIADPELLELAGRVEVVFDPELDALYPERYANLVEVVLKDGRRLARRVDFPKGSGQRPLALAEVEGKMRSLSSRTLSAERAGEIVAAVRNFDKLDNVGRFTALLR